MFKLIRWLLTLVFVAVVGGVIAAQFVTFNQFKTLAAQKAKEATGRNLEIAGDIKLSFYPVLGGKIEKISLSNVPGAEQPSMISVEKVMIGIKLLPLLHKQVELEKIVLEKPVIYLEKDNAGKGNWEFPGAAAAPAASASKNKESMMQVRLSGIEISDGILSYHDRKSDGKATELAKINGQVNLVDMDSPVQVNATAEYQGIPLKLALETDSPSALLSEKGSATSLDAAVYGISGKMAGKISITPTRASATNVSIAIQQILAKGKIDVALGGAVPVVNAAIDFGTVNLDPLIELADAASATQKKPTTGNPAVKKSSYLDTSAFKAIEGSIALSADSVQTNAWKIAQPRIRANMAGGVVATAAAGQFSSAAQSPVNISFTSADIAALLKADGGTFSLKAKSDDKDLAAQGNLALVPGHVALSNATIKVNDQTITGRAIIDEKSGDQALEAELQLIKNDQQWQISAATPALQKLMTAEGAPLVLVLQSGGEKAEINTNFSNADKVIKLNPLTLVLNGGTGKGYLTFDQKASVPKLDLNLEFAALDVNPLLSFAQQQSGNGDEASSGTAAAGRSKEKPLREMNAQVNIRAKQFKAKALQMTNIDLNATLKDGMLDIVLPEAGLYQGRTTLKAHVDGNTSIPHFTANTEGHSVNIGALLVEAVQDDTFAGIGNWKAQISGNGSDLPGIYHTLDGRGEFELVQGVVRGMDLFRLMSAVRGKLGAESLIQTTDETNQLHAKGSFNIAKGIVENNDLVLQSPNIEAAGKGSISLPQWQINYRFEPKVGERRKAGQGEKFVGQSIPVLVQGSLDHPKIFPDPKALINTGVDMLKGIKGVNKYLAPLGLGGTETAPAQPADPAAPPPPAGKIDPLNVLQGIINNQ